MLLASQCVSGAGLHRPQPLPSLRRQLQQYSPSSYGYGSYASPPTYGVQSAAAPTPSLFGTGESLLAAVLPAQLVLSVATLAFLQAPLCAVRPSCTGNGCLLTLVLFDICVSPRVGPFDIVVLCCHCRRNDPAASHDTDPNGLRHACPSRLRADSSAACTSGQGVHPGCTLNNASSPSSLWHSPLPCASSVRHTSNGLSCGEAFQHGLTPRASRHRLLHAPHAGAAQLRQHLAVSRTDSQGHGHATSHKQSSTR